MNKCSLGIHEVKLVVQPCPGLHDGRGVGETADSPVDLGKITAWDYGGRLVVDANLYVNDTRERNNGLCNVLKSSILSLGSYHLGKTVRGLWP